MKIIELYQDYGIDFATEGQKHCREGWVNTPCPFCTGNPGYHLGYNTDDDYFHCWRCGGKNTVKTLAALLTINEKAVKQIVKDYGGVSYSKPKQREPKVNIHPLKFPTPFTGLTEAHIHYLRKRRFNPQYLEKEWGIVGTEFFSKLDKIDYSRRVVIPIYWEGRVVSFQTRDITGTHPLKYLACPMKREEIEHQTILYKHPDYDKRFGITVEGVTDVWRIGKQAFATFGIDYTSSQVRWIAKLYDEVVIWFDPEPQAQHQARKLKAELEFRGIKTRNFVTSSDPADMKQIEVNNIIYNDFK